MELPSRPKDNLFDDSTMTFGEHLEELRRALRGAVIWLAVGLAIGLLFADRLVNFVQEPLQDAILTFRADRELARRGLDPDDPNLKTLKGFLVQNEVEIETIFLVPQANAAGTEPTPASEPTPAGEPTPASEPTPTGEPTPTSESAPQSESDPEASAVGETPAEAAPTETADETSEAADGKAEAAASLPDFIVAEQADLSALIREDLDIAQLERQVILRPSRASLNSHKTEEGFMIWIKAGLMIGAVLASPMIFRHLWGFVAAGLYEHERRYVYIYLPISVVLFTAGVCLAFFFVLYYVLTFLLAFNAGMNVDIQPRLSYYMNFVLLLPLGFGIAFQLPLVMMFLERIGIFTVESYVSSWRIAILVISIISMIATPADVTSMVALAIPLVFLYFLGILMCKYIPRGRGLGSAALDPR